MTPKERSFLRAKANGLKPIVNVGKGNVNQNLLSEIDTALFHNELIKIALLKSATVTVAESIESITAALGCECVSSIGSKIVLYRESDKEGIEHIL